MNRVEPAHFPSCFKTFNQESCQIPWYTGTTPGATVSPPGRRQGDTGTFREHLCLHRDNRVRGRPSVCLIFQQCGMCQQQNLRSACA